MDEAQSRTNCLSKLGCPRPGSYSSAGQKREESGVQISSPMVSVAVGVEAELELGVGEDDPALARVLGGVLVQRERDVAHALGQRPVADQLDRALEVDRLVVADVGLGARGEQRLGQAV